MKQPGNRGAGTPAEGQRTGPLPLRLGRPVRVHSTKYDGSLHYRWRPLLVAARPALVAAHMAPGGFFQSYRGRFGAVYHYLLICWANADYNLLVSWHADWRPRFHYLNVIADPTWADGTIRFVDLDVDVVWRHGAPAPVVRDVDELLENAKRFGYPPGLVRRCLERAEELRARMAARAAPFDGRLYAWRPGAALPI